MAKMSPPMIQGFNVLAMRQPHQTAGGGISESPLVLTDVIAE